MMIQMDPDFRRRLDDWNSARGGPAVIDLVWNPKKDRWQVFAVPVADSTHPLARHKHTSKLISAYPDGSGKQGILLNTWQGAKGEFLPLDERLFEALDYADSFKSRHHFEETIKNPEIQAELAISKKARDMAYASRSYWQKLDSLTINPNIPAGGDWRAKERWR